MVAEQPAVPAIDAFGRRIDYLRISLTDRCQFRCIYCMPRAGVRFLPRPELLTNAELLRVTAAAARVGFRKLRLTGGEPLLRPGLIDLIREMRAIPGIAEITMTTNGMRLRGMAGRLAEAGLDRVNVSLDTLDPEQFRQITFGGEIDQVWPGLQEAQDAGLLPLKVNAVIVRGLNDSQVPGLAALTVERGWDVRFIEVMPLTGVSEIADEALVMSAELIARIETALGPLQALPTPVNDPARRYRLPGAAGTIGFISSVSEPFCSSCNRLRLTAEGRLHLCLLRDDEVDLREALRAGASEEELAAMVRDAVAIKPWGHGLQAGLRPTQRSMSQIGG
jgi:cyclic pyranopterin phosphate synthase